MNEKLILTIIDKFSSASIGELDLEDGTTRLKLRKALTGAGTEAAAPGSAGVETKGIAREGLEDSCRSGSPGRTGGEIPEYQKHPGSGKELPREGEKITSPIVSTFYASPSPDAPPYVKPGAKVKAGETLCILEAMKMMNHLVAEYDCEIIEVHAANGDMVEYGQTLFTVNRS
jgi:acetyl-CoA carboxylase biotin carboxyl carrier protein